MSNAIKETKPNQSTDLVLQEIRRIKDALSACCKGEAQFQTSAANFIVHLVLTKKNHR